MRPLLSGALAIALVVPTVTAAQSLGDISSATTPFTVATSPQYPLPHGQVTLSFLSSSLDLASATVSVTAGGKKIYQGAVRPVSVTLGNSGNITNVTATISLGNARYSQSLSVQPQDVALVVEPVSSAPPLYPGKSAVPLEGDARIVAVANLQTAMGRSLDPASLSYSWTVDGIQIANSSGVGKTAIMVATPLQYRSRDVSVAVISPDGSLVGGASVSLSSQEPLVRLYENDPLLGIRFERALSTSFVIGGSESTLYAAPFSLPTTSGAPLLRWFLNGEAAQTGGSITLRPAGSGRGRASLSFTASAGSYTTAAANLSLSFGASSGSNFFGL